MKDLFMQYEDSNSDHKSQDKSAKQPHELARGEAACADNSQPGNATGPLVVGRAGGGKPNGAGKPASGAEASAARVEGTEYRDDLNPDKEAAKRFLTQLDPAAEEFTFQTFDDNKVRRKDNKNAGRTDPLERVMHGTLEECWPELVKLSRRGAGIFVTLNRIEPPLDEHGKAKKRGRSVPAQKQHLSYPL